MPLATSGLVSSNCVLSAFQDEAEAGCSWRKSAPRSSCASSTLATKSKWARASRRRRPTSASPIFGRSTWTLSEHQSVRGGPPKKR
eukprot:8920349-Alexandrium_andersonii.AAC.1